MELNNTAINQIMQFFSRDDEYLLNGVRQEMLLTSVASEPIVRKNVYQGFPFPVETLFAGCANQIKTVFKVVFTHCICKWKCLEGKHDHNYFI